MQASFFRQNRARLGEALQGGVVILAAYTKMQRSSDMAFDFEQESNFWYLTGIERPDWLLVYEGAHDHAWLIAPEIDAVHQTFDGWLDHQAAQRISAVDAVYTNDEGLQRLRKLAKRHAMVYTIDHPAYAHRFDFSLNPAIHRHKAMLERTFTTVRDCTKDLARLRAIKQPDEITAIKQAIKLTATAFDTVKTKLISMRHEYEIAAEFTYQFTKNNARHAYDPIVAAGAHACTLHYTANDGRLKKPQLVLLDVGARVDGYAADITRTYAYGSLTKRQQAVHIAVRQAHQRIIDMVAPGLAVTQYQQRVDEIMSETLQSLGLLKINDEAALRRYLPHAVSHGLGVDVHDSLGSPRYFEPGMVLTVEPGIYIPEENIGVRIEDDILIGEQRAINLSAKLSTAA